MSRSKQLVNGTQADGTSFSVDNAQIREALNLSAWYPDLGWDPTSGTMPISPVAPCTQTGWGLVNLSNIQPIIKHLNGTESLGERPGDVVACMDLNQAAREAYWSAYPSSPTTITVAGDEGVRTRD